jgi:cold shock protein
LLSLSKLVWWLEMLGTIKFFKEDKGFGFITGEDNQEYFLHVSQIKMIDSDNIPFTGDKVEFEPKKTNKGLQARSCIFIK